MSSSSGSSGLAAQHTARAARWIDILRRQFPELLEELAPGRPGAGTRSRPPLGPAALRALGERDRAERDEALLGEQHGIAPLGESAAPIRLHVSDAIRDITDGVVELEEAVWEKLGLGRPTRADVPRRLGRITALLDDIAGHPVLARHVLDECRRMARRCGRTLGDPETLVRVNGRCPWCDSVSLRAMPAWRTVLCVNPGCRCADEECPCAENPAHRHSWMETGWAQLAAEAGADAIAPLVDATDAPPVAPPVDAVEEAEVA
ncbi:hypothetical protein [Streptomyces ipomoeae]|uniref:Uncharacterized protein n=1 Tax=Streptomyces ipomoeae 91-03 TaxID=698759 RepID=L1L2M0_9ACTN|nr:hypothetical protein [Streptomyces ipomoeae]EKX67157.1 hypothetical protein STRIP9103_03533 [Streptomyces ipomoeae 91-03]MDX2695528.1 hypothetical protein [Streptomyces ipomoeae]MDX2841508.1 hypothetical protein [Streptomyces ipomoeae]